MAPLSSTEIVRTEIEVSVAWTCTMQLAKCDVGSPRPTSSAKITPRQINGIKTTQDRRNSQILGVPNPAAHASGTTVSATLKRNVPGWLIKGLFETKAQNSLVEKRGSAPESDGVVDLTGFGKGPAVSLHCAV